MNCRRIWKNHQNTVVTQANDESSKNANESAKATKVLRTTAKMIDELLPNDKSHQNMAGTQGKYEKNNKRKHKCKTNKALRTMRKCYMNYCWIWKKTSKYCGHTGWLQRHKECKWKLKSNKVLRTTAKMIQELVPHTSKSHQNIAGTQGNYEKTKNANENPKATKYCAQQQKWYMNYCRIGKKSWKHCGHAEWYDFSPSDTT